MRLRQGEFDRIREALAEADPDGPLTARQILDICEEQGVSFDSTHRVATILGRRAESGEVEVIRDQPYRYRLTDLS